MGGNGGERKKADGRGTTGGFLLSSGEVAGADQSASLQKDKWTSLRYTRRPYTLEILSLKPRRKVTVILEVLDMEGRSDWVETNSVAICDGIVV